MSSKLLVAAFSSLCLFGLLMAWSARQDVAARLEAVEAAAHGTRSKVTFEWSSGLLDVTVEHSGMASPEFVDDACSTFDALAGKYPPKE